jgi:hypothetical protein
MTNSIFGTPARHGDPQVYGKTVALPGTSRDFAVTQSIAAKRDSAPFDTPMKKAICDRSQMASKWRIGDLNP